MGHQWWWYSISYGQYSRRVPSFFPTVTMSEAHELLHGSIMFLSNILYIFSHLFFPSLGNTIGRDPEWWCKSCINVVVFSCPGQSLNTSGLLYTRSTSCCRWLVEIVGSVVNVPPGSQCGVIRSESASSSSGTVTVITAATGECQGFSILT